MLYPYDISPQYHTNVLSKTGHPEGTMAEIQNFVWEFRVLFYRSVVNYVRNPGNVAARVAVNLICAFLEGLALYNLDSNDVRNRIGALFFLLIFQMLLPYASISLFIFDRHFYQKDSAAGLYGTAAYYVGTVFLEVLLSVIIGTLNMVVVFKMVNLSSTGTGTLAELVGTNILVNLCGVSWIQVMALLAPNQDLAFLFGAAYTATCLLCSGFLISFPALSPMMSWFEWLSVQKYAFQAYCINEFRDTDVEKLVIEKVLDLKRPDTVQANCLALLAFISMCMFVSYMALKYMHIERR